MCRATLLCACVAVLMLGGPARHAWAQDPGDANCDGVVDAADSVSMVDALFGSAPVACPGTDANRDGNVSAADLVALGLLLSAGPQGPTITFFGLADASGVPLGPIGVADDVPLYYRTVGTGFQLVIESRAGPSGDAPGISAYNWGPDDPLRRPDLQIEVDQPLGNGGAAVCEEGGGVPAVNPPTYGPFQFVTDAINDLGCRFGAPATSPQVACTQDIFGVTRFVDATTQVQFCLQWTRPLEVSTGEATLRVRWRDSGGNLGPVRQLRLQVGSGPPPSTFTPTPSRPTAMPTRTPTRTPVATGTATKTPSARPTSTASNTPRPSMTPTSVRSSTATPSSTAASSATPTGYATATRAPTQPTATRTAGTPLPTRTRTSGPAPTSTPVRPATATPSATRTVTVTSTASASPTPPATATVTRTVTPTLTATRTATRRPTLAPTVTPTATRTPTPVPTPTPTSAVPIGPIVSFVGVANQGDLLVPKSGDSPEGWPIYVRAPGAVFWLIVEGRPGLSRYAVGPNTFVPDASSFPDLQIETSNALGNGSTAVCDQTPPNVGGVPGVDPASFDPTATNFAVVNDLACRFLDGFGHYRGRGPSDACVLDPTTEDYGFVNGASTMQFCGRVESALAFPPGDTLVTVRLRDVAGNVGEPAYFIVREQG